MGAQVCEMVSPTNLVMEFNLPLRFLVLPRIITVLVIVLVLFPIPTPFIVSSLLFIPFGFLVTLLVRRMYREYMHRLGGIG